MITITGTITGRIIRHEVWQKASFDLFTGELLHVVCPLHLVDGLGPGVIVRVDGFRNGIEVDGRTICRTECGNE